MGSSRRGVAGHWPVLLAGFAIAHAAAPAAARDTHNGVVRPAAVVSTVDSGPVSVETVYFTDHRLPPVRLVRGAPKAAPLPIPTGHTEVVSFGTGFASQVKIVRGGSAPDLAMTRRQQTAASPRDRIETVGFADPRQRSVIIVRGPTLHDLMSVDLFAPADGPELDRIAFAVDGVESRHGADPGMWRPEPSGPQGPMQVSAAAALDVGGGDRFDIRENRLLGRAYLAQMFRRYGNWTDALAAYNWGPGSVDQWIVGGRRPEAMPIGVLRYVERVLRDAVITIARAF